MRKNEQRVCVIIPAYNEAAVLGSVIKDIQTNSNRSAYDIEVVVVNDASKDATSSVARNAGAIVIDHILNSGAGGATATGLSYADQNDFDIAVTMDADGQHDSADVMKGIEILQERNVDLLIGSRLIDSEGMSRVKVLGNKGLSLVTFLIFGIGSTDSQSGLRVFSRRSLEELRWKTSGYEFCSEMLWRAKQQGLRISEYPIKAIYTEYSKAKGQNNWNAITSLKALS